MTGKKQRPDDAPAASSGPMLRQRAEAAFLKKAAQPQERLEARLPEATRQALHELRVHQIELEMQNEELRLAQEALDVLRARYFDLYDLAPVGYFTVGETGLILEANLTAATLLGVARNALVKTPISRSILKEDQDAYYLHRKQLTETGQPQSCELRMVRHGTPFWAHLAAAAAQDADGSPVCRAVMTDITERKKAEAALRESESRYRRFIETTQEGFGEIDPAGRIVSGNARLNQMFGYAPGEMIGLNIVEELIFQEDRISFRERHQSRKQGKPDSYEQRFRKKTGVAAWFIVSAAPIINENGVVCGSFALMTDITARKQAEAELECLKTAIEQTGESLFITDPRGPFSSSIRLSRL